MNDTEEVNSEEVKRLVPGDQAYIETPSEYHRKRYNSLYIPVEIVEDVGHGYRIKVIDTGEGSPGAWPNHVIFRTPEEVNTAVLVRGFDRIRSMEVDLVMAYAEYKEDLTLAGRKEKSDDTSNAAYAELDERIEDHS